MSPQASSPVSLSVARDAPSPPRGPRLLDRVRLAIRARHYSPRTRLDTGSWTAQRVMTMQPTPTVTAADVERIVRRDFPADRAVVVLAMLEEYRKESWQREPHRVRLAALKLAAGDIKRLRYEIEGAKCDYRDILGPAEYPGYTKRMFRIGELTQDERQRIIDDDWKQYQEWLTR